MSDYRTTLLAENEKLRAEVERLRGSMQCKGCGGTVGDHLAPDQGGCTGLFSIDGVEMTPSRHRDSLRAEANARAVIELQWVANMMRGGVFDSAWTQARIAIADRIAELSKPAAKESEPSPQEKQRRGFAFGNTNIENPRITPEMVDAEAEKLAKESDPAKDDTAKCWSCGGQGYIGTTSGIPGMIGYAHNSCSRCGGTGKLHYVAMEQLKDGEPEKPVTGPNYLDQEEWGHTKPAKEIEPAKDERLGDWPLSYYVADYNPATASPLETAVYHLCRKAMGGES